MAGPFWRARRKRVMRMPIALLTAIVPVIRRSVRGKLPTPDAADDVVQDILLSVHKALHASNPARPFLPWLSSDIVPPRGFPAAASPCMIIPAYPLIARYTNYLISEESLGSLKDIEEAFDEYYQ